MKMSKTLLVFLHGSGGTGPEIRSYLNSIQLDKYAMQTFQSLAKARNMDYVCPTANTRRYTPAMGERMNVWFDRSVDFQRRGLNDLEDLEGANKSVDQVRVWALVK